MTQATWGVMLEASWVWQGTETGCCHLGGRGLILPCGWSDLILAGCQRWREEIYCQVEGGNVGPRLRPLLAGPNSVRWEAPWSRLWPRTCLQRNTRQERTVKKTLNMKTGQTETDSFREEVGDGDWLVTRKEGKD